MMLKEAFTQLVSQYTNKDRLVETLWDEVEANYSHKKRHYHTLSHLDNLLNQLTEVKQRIKDWNTVLFSVYYHDIIYNPLKSNNEEKSADIAETRMGSISVPQKLIENCKQKILATKRHLNHLNADTNYFTDADLSILGQSWELYTDYFKKIRKEYAIYPDLVYKPGREKVLKHFLKMERIFKTDYFFEKFEIQAKQNLQNELETL